MHDNTKLCQRLLFSSFGDQAVASILLERGRLSFGQLRNLLPGMSAQQIAKCLGVLLQHHCIFHSMLASAESRSEERRTFYEANQRDILARLRFGRLVALHSTKDFVLKEELLEELARPLVEMLLLHGKLKLSELLDRLLDGEDAIAIDEGMHNGRAHLNGVSGKGKGKAAAAATRGGYMAVVRLMLQKRFLRVVTPRQMMSDADRELKQEQAIFRKAQEAHGRMPTAQQIKKVRNEVISAGSLDATAQEELDEEYLTAVAGVKRKADGSDVGGRLPHAKRFKADVELNEECYLRVNVDRYMMATRDTQIKNAVRSRYGVYARDVITAMLVAIREDVETDSAMNGHISRSVSTAEICQHLPAAFKEGRQGRKNAFIDKCVATRSAGDRSGSWHNPSGDQSALVREICEVMAGPDSEHSDDEEEAAPQHTPLLSRHRPWLHRVNLAAATNRVGSEWWRIDFGAISAAIKHGLLEDLIMRRFGDKGHIACRLVNLITAKGHVDEKQLAKLALIPAKEVRTMLSELSSQRLVESQEVPRSKSDRSRSIFYYYVDASSWQTILLSEIYQALGNLMTRMAEELELQSSMLARLERSDVAGDVSQLPDADTADLGKLNVRLECLKTAIERCDEDRYVLEMPDS